MLENAIKILKIINDKGYKAYIVGGFVRNYLLGIESNDIDITTSATPKQLQEIFPDIDLPDASYGSVILNSNGVRYEITTFRKEAEYLDNRHPVAIEYVDSLEEDVQRRDFTINTICLDKDGEIIDLVGGKSDLDNKIVRTVGEADKRIKEDSLRILRAIRFAATLNFALDKDLEKAIINNKSLLRDLSYNRKREELDKMFTNVNAMSAIKMLLKFSLDKELELDRLKEVQNVDSVLAVWSVLNSNKYPFTNTEKELIKDIKEAIKSDNYDNYTLYKYGLYANQTAGVIKGLDKKKITELYNGLVIQSRKDLDITSDDIMNATGKGQGEYIKDIYNDLEKEVLYYKLGNTKSELIKYIKSNINKY